MKTFLIENECQTSGGCHSFSIKNIFYDKMDLGLFYFHVTNYKMFSSSSVNAHHDITAFEVDGMLYNIEN